MNKTIEERVLDKCNKDWSTRYTDPSQIHDELDRSYYDGCVEAAYEQQKIDIEQTCDWIREHVRMVDYLPTFVSSITHPMYGDEFVNMFKAAMEEK